MQSHAHLLVHALPGLNNGKGASVSWRGDVVMGKYGKLPRALIDNNMFPGVKVDCGSFAVACPCCGSQIPCLDIRFIDARDRFSDEVRKRTGVHMPVYPEKCPVCGLDIACDAGDEG